MGCSFDSFNQSLLFPQDILTRHLAEKSAAENQLPPLGPSAWAAGSQSELTPSESLATSDAVRDTSQPNMTFSHSVYFFALFLSWLVSLKSLPVQVFLSNPHCHALPSLTFICFLFYLLIHLSSVSVSGLSPFILLCLVFFIPPCLPFFTYQMCAPPIFIVFGISLTGKLQRSVREKWPFSLSLVRQIRHVFFVLCQGPKGSANWKPGLCLNNDFVQE